MLLVNIWIIFEQRGDTIGYVSVVMVNLIVGINHHVDFRQQFASFHQMWPATVKILNVLVGEMGRDEQNDIHCVCYWGWAQW